MGHESRVNPFSRENRPDGLIDARGRKLEVGDEIILNVGGPVYFRVTDIRPNLDPKAPAGMQTITVGAVLTFFAPKNIPQREFVRVRTSEEAGPSELVMLPDAPMKEDVGNRPKDPA